VLEDIILLALQPILLLMMERVGVLFKLYKYLQYDIHVEDVELPRLA
jgi:hypothetical protein